MPILHENASTGASNFDDFQELGGGYSSISCYSSTLAQSLLGTQAYRRFSGVKFGAIGGAV